MIPVDLLIRNIGQLVNPATDHAVRGEAMNSLRILEGGVVAAVGERIAFVGREADFAKACQVGPETVEIDAEGMVALPGLVDPHSHLPFAGTRQDEFQQKLQGTTYQEIAARGGGIKKTVRLTREISAPELTQVCERRLDAILAQGTTLLEAKSGYGLTLASELKQLETIEALSALHPVELVPTFMGAHEIPPEFAGRSGAFLEHLASEVAPEVRRRGLAQFADIFCEEGYFTVDEARRYLTAMKKLGFGLKLHADEFTSNGAASLAAELGATSAEHLIAATPEEIAILGASDTVAVLLPGVSFFLKLGRYAPAREFLRQGGIVALGTDFNPGSSMISSQLFTFWLGIFEMGLTVEQALHAVTINAAAAVGKTASHGSIVSGKKMDLLLLDIPDYSTLAYHPGSQPVHTVVKAGEVVIRGRRPLFREE